MTEMRLPFRPSPPQHDFQAAADSIKYHSGRTSASPPARTQDGFESHPECSPLYQSVKPFFPVGCNAFPMYAYWLLEEFLVLTEISQARMASPRAKSDEVPILAG